MTSPGYRVQLRGQSGCVVYDAWTDVGAPPDSLEGAIAYARSYGGDWAIRVVAPDGTVTPVRGQQSTIVNGPLNADGSPPVVLPKQEYKP